MVVKMRRLPMLRMSTRQFADKTRRRSLQSETEPLRAGADATTTYTRISGVYDPLRAALATEIKPPQRTNVSDVKRI